MKLGWCTARRGRLQLIFKQDLLRVKTRALRMNIWFQTLSRTERAIMDLTAKCIERIRSRLLEATISSILEKILEALGCGFLERVEKAGRPIAERMCEIAQKWGNEHASEWRSEADFVRFLGINAVNP